MWNHKNRQNEWEGWTNAEGVNLWQQTRSQHIVCVTRLTQTQTLMLVEAQINELQDASRVLMRYICTDSFFTGFTTAFHDFCFSSYWTNRLPFSTPTALRAVVCIHSRTLTQTTHSDSALFCARPFFIWCPHSHADGCISSNLWFGVSLRTFRLEEPGIEPPVFRLVDIGHYDIEPSSVVRIQETEPFLILRLGFKLSSLMKLIVS